MDGLVQAVSEHAANTQEGLWGSKVCENMIHKAVMPPKLE